MSVPPEWDEALIYGQECVQGFNTAIKKFQNFNKQTSKNKAREILSQKCPQFSDGKKWKQLPVQSLNEYYEGIVYAVANAQSVVKNLRSSTQIQLNPIYESRQDLHELLKQSCLLDQLTLQLQSLENSLKLIRLDSSEEELFLAETIWETVPPWSVDDKKAQ